MMIRLLHSKENVVTFAVIAVWSRNTAVKQGLSYRETLAGPHSPRLDAQWAI